MKIDPKHHQQLHRWLGVILTAMVLAALAWAIIPDRAQTGEFDIDEFTHVEPTNSSPQASSDTFDPSVFGITLWYEPPTPEPIAPLRPTPPPRFTLELMAISVEAGRDAQPARVAVVYDTQDDTVHTLHVGDRCGGATIESISEESVEVRVGTQTVRLALEVAG